MLFTALYGWYLVFTYSYIPEYYTEYSEKQGAQVLQSSKRLESTLTDYLLVHMILLLYPWYCRQYLQPTVEQYLEQYLEQYKTSTKSYAGHCHEVQ